MLNEERTGFLSNMLFKTKVSSALVLACWSITFNGDGAF